MRSKIIFEDEDILVVQKPAGFPVQTSGIGSMDLVSELKNYLKKKNPRSGTYLGVIHRLDQPVEGLMVFAKNQKAASGLSAQVSAQDDSKMVKCYEARIYGHLPEKKGILENYLKKAEKENRSFVVPKEEGDENKKGKESGAGKYSKLTYEVLEENSESQRIRVQLFTGRHHQIRVQFSYLGNPLLGDLKYGTTESIDYSKRIGIRDVALKAVHLEFVHPGSKKHMEWSLE